METNLGNIVHTNISTMATYTENIVLCLCLPLSLSVCDCCCMSTGVSMNFTRTLPKTHNHTWEQHASIYEYETATKARAPTRSECVIKKQSFWKYAFNDKGLAQIKCTVCCSFSFPVAFSFNHCSPLTIQCVYISMLYNVVFSPGPTPIRPEFRSVFSSSFYCHIKMRFIWEWGDLWLVWSPSWKPSKFTIAEQTKFGGRGGVEAIERNDEKLNGTKVRTKESFPNTFTGVCTQFDGI